MKSSLQKKVAGILFVFFIIPLIILIAFFFQYNKISNQNSTNSSLEAILKIKGQELNLFFENNIKSAKVYLDMPILKDYLKLRNIPSNLKTEEDKQKEELLFKTLNDILYVFQKETWGKTHHLFLVDQKDMKIFMSPDHGKNKIGQPSNHLGQFTGDNIWIKKAFDSELPQITDHTHWTESDHFHQMIFVPMEKIEGVDHKILMGMELEIPYEQSLLEKGLDIEGNEKISLIGLDGTIIDKHKSLHIDYKDFPMLKKSIDYGTSKSMENINKESYSNLYFHEEGNSWLLTARLSLDKMKASKSSLNIKNLFLIMPIVLILLLILTVMLLNIYIVGPIKKLSETTKDFGQGKKEKLKNITRYFSRKDEIGDLAMSIDVMTSQIEKSKENLEEKVLERTKQLEKEQQKSKQKLKELKRWQKTTIGRELKMIELKKEIRKLKTNTNNVDITEPKEFENTENIVPKIEADTSVKSTTKHDENILDILIKQHREIASIATNITNLSKDTVGNSEEILSSLTELSKKITEHIQIEDKLFYPQLLTSMKKRDMDITKIEMFIKDMDDILNSADEFFRKYNSAQNITNNATQFNIDFKPIASVLSIRMESEEDGVYLYWDFSKDN